MVCILSAIYFIRISINVFDRFDVRDCREMYRGNNKSSPYITGRVCNYNQRVIYAWAKDAPELKLPEGVGFKIGGNSGINYLVLQVHYMHPLSGME